MGSKTKLSSPILYCMMAGHKINHEIAKAKESEKTRIIKFLQVELLYRHLTNTPLKLDIVGLLWLFETFRMRSVQRAHSGKGIEIPQNVSSQVMNRRLAYSASHVQEKFLITLRTLLTV